MLDYKFLHQKYLVNTYPNRGPVFTHGEGMYLYDEHGKKYLDLMSNYGVSIFGYNHPEIQKYFYDQISKIITLHCSFNNDARALAAEKLVKRCAGGLSQVYFSNSGAEAVEAALKFAVMVTGKKKFIACRSGYHGKTLGALSATYGIKYKQQFEPLLWQFTHIEYDNIEQLERNIDADTAAFIVEPVQGEGGIRAPEERYLQRVRELCDKYQVLLILDEIQSGMGRTGRFLASEGINYDIVCLGKGLAGGMPVGATLVSPKVGSGIHKNTHTSTFGGNPLSCAGILGALHLLDNELLQHIQSIGRYFHESLQNINSPHIVQVRGKGLMLGVEVVAERRNEILKKLQERTVLAIPASDSVVRFLPPYIIEKHHVDFAVETFKEVLQTL